jgi:hypothetical protein
VLARIVNSGSENGACEPAPYGSLQSQEVQLMTGAPWGPKP